MNLVAEGELLREIDRFRGLARRIPRQELDLAAEDAARIVDFVDGKLDPLVLGDCRRRERSRKG